jgi:Kef-type K+ transport system membrane component KefB
MLSAVGLMVFSGTLVNPNDLVGDKKSFTGVLGILVCLCILVLLFILLLSRKLKEKYEE